MTPRCPQCKERTVRMSDERNGDEYYVCHDCKWAGRKTEVYSRCCGYLRPIDGWNLGKREEFNKRRTYNLAKAQQHIQAKSKKDKEGQEG